MNSMNFLKLSWGLKTLEFSGKNLGKPTNDNFNFQKNSTDFDS
jgi:hypothetical protein